MFTKSTRKQVKMNNKLILKLDKSKTYILACSFGPDSMALLDAAIKDNLKVVVAHVNYHKRDVSNFEQESLEKYCSDKHIPIEVLDTNGLEMTGNFQEWAREIRYKFFADVLIKYSADAVLVAHQEDDLIETYLMQKKRGNFVKYIGIARENVLFGVKIIRPLLDYSKQYLLDYDKENNVPYSIDESNLTDHYERNRVRHHEVAALTIDERKAIIEEVKNQRKPNISFDTEIDLDIFLDFDYQTIIKILDYYMNFVGEHRDLSQKYIEQIKVAFKSYSNMWFSITESIILEKNYGIVSIVNSKKLKDYEYKIDSKFVNNFFEINFETHFDDRGIKASDFPLTIKNVKPGEKIKINDYESDVRRAFIDWKVPHYLRKVWPGVYNSKNELIYVPRYRKDYEDNHKSVFKFRTGYFREF